MHYLRIIFELKVHFFDVVNHSPHSARQDRATGAQLRDGRPLPERLHRPLRHLSCHRAVAPITVLAAAAVACTVEPSPRQGLSVGGADGEDGGGGETRLPVGMACWLVLVILIGAGHGRSDPSRSGLNTICDRSDAHRGRASGGVYQTQVFDVHTATCIGPILVCKTLMI